MVHAMAQADVFHGLLGFGLPLMFRYVRIIERQFHVLQYRRSRQEIESLEYEADFSIPQIGQFIAGE